MTSIFLELSLIFILLCNNKKLILFKSLFQGTFGKIKTKTKTKNTCQCWRHKRGGFDPRVGKTPGGGNGDPPQYSCQEKYHGQRSLAGYSPQGCKESDTTEATQRTLMYIFRFQCNRDSNSYIQKLQFFHLLSSHLHIVPLIYFFKTFLLLDILIVSTSLDCLLFI